MKGLPTNLQFLPDNLALVVVETEILLLEKLEKLKKVMEMNDKC